MGAREPVSEAVASCPPGKGKPTRDKFPQGGGRRPDGYEQVEGIQRARIVSAMVEIAAQEGFIGAAVAAVVARAGVSRRTFYELFTGREDCFLAAFEWGVSQAKRAMAQEYDSRGSWRERVRHSVAALLALLDAEPELARVCVIEALGAGRLVLERRGQLLGGLATVLQRDAPSRGQGQAPLLTAEGIVGGALSVIHGRLLASTPEVEDLQVAAETKRVDGPSEAPSGSTRLGDSHGQLMALIVLPYLGPRAAAEELTRLAPNTAPNIEPRLRLDGTGGRLLERLDMRLTYRTVRCLMFIVEHPACSNREIARGAEMSDEGQTSKLLARLLRLGLISNSQAQGPGHPNRWALTDQGERVLGSVRGR